jgi:hypothetical protein
MQIDSRNRLLWTPLIGALALSGCKLLEDEAKDAKETVEETFSSEVTGAVTDNRGEGVEGVTVRLYDLLDNSDFVEGSDITALEAYIDREAVLASDNDVASGVTEADGGFRFEVRASAFLAVAIKSASRSRLSWSPARRRPRSALKATARRHRRSSRSPPRRPLAMRRCAARQAVTARAKPV